MAPTLYPIFLNIENRPVLMVGGGPVAAVKTRPLVQCGARVTVVAPEVCDEMQAHIDEHRLEHRARLFAPDDLDGKMLVVSATGLREVNAKVADAARERGIMVNAVDDPPSCDYFVPAVVRRGPLTVAISTTGFSPAFAKKYMREMERQVPQHLGDYITLLESFRDEIKTRFPGDFDRRRVVHETILASPAESMVNRGDLEAARAEIRRIIDELAAEQPA